MCLPKPTPPGGRTESPVDACTTWHSPSLPNSGGSEGQSRPKPLLRGPKARLYGPSDPPPQSQAKYAQASTSPPGGEARPSLTFTTHEGPRLNSGLNSDPGCIKVVDTFRGASGTSHMPSNAAASRAAGDSAPKLVSRIRSCAVSCSWVRPSIASQNARALPAVEASRETGRISDVER